MRRIRDSLPPPLPAPFDTASTPVDRVQEFGVFFLAKVCAPAAAARAREMSTTPAFKTLVNSVLKSCHSSSLSALIARRDASTVSPSVLKTIPTFIVGDTDSPLTFWKGGAARSYYSILQRRSFVKWNLISSSKISADPLLSFGPRPATSERRALRLSPSPLVTTLSNAGAVVKCSKRW